MLKVHTRKLGNVAVVSVQGRIVNGETASLRQEVGSQSTVNTVLLDLARVSTIDASGLGLMLEMREETQSKGMRFKLMNVTNLVGRVLAVTKLDSVFEITRVMEPMPAIAHANSPRMMPYARCA
jgi:anti-anti-sigma factor